MTRRRTTAVWLPLVTLFAANTFSCASAPSPVEPPRSAEVPGLGFPPPDSVPLPGATRPAAAIRDPAAATTSPTGALTPPPPRDTPCPARIGARAVRRSALSHTLDAGLGNWLRGVDVEPKIERGHFQGWLVRAIYTGDPCWADVDLRVGDVVNRVNRRPIERPEQAQAVWSALRSAGEIVVDFSRNGQPRILKFAVVDDGG